MRVVQSWVEWDTCSKHATLISRPCALVMRNASYVRVNGKWSCASCSRSNAASEMSEGIGRLDARNAPEANLGSSALTLNDLDVLEDDEMLLQLALDDEYRRVQRDFPDAMPPLGGGS